LTYKNKKTFTKPVSSNRYEIEGVKFDTTIKELK